MKKFTYCLLLTSALTLAACGGETDVEETMTDTTEDVVETVDTMETEMTNEAEEVMETSLMDPNTLDIQALAAEHEFIQPDMVTAWESERPFDDMQDFHRFVMEYLNRATANSLYEKVFVPLDLNTTPMQRFTLIPGVNAQMAGEFEEYKPYTSMDQFDQEIGKYVDADEVARLRQYVVIN